METLPHDVIRHIYGMLPFIAKVTASRAIPQVYRATCPTSRDVRAQVVKYVGAELMDALDKAGAYIVGNHLTAMLHDGVSSEISVRHHNGAYFDDLTACIMDVLHMDLVHCVPYHTDGVSATYVLFGNGTAGKLERLHMYVTPSTASCDAAVFRGSVLTIWSLRFALAYRA
jgi:hypothetical protein